LTNTTNATPSNHFHHQTFHILMSSSTAATFTVSEQQRRIDILYDYLVSFDITRNTLPAQPPDNIDFLILENSAHIAAMRASLLRNVNYIEALVRANAELLVRRDVDIFLFSRPQEITEVIRLPATSPLPESLPQPPTPYVSPSKVDDSALPPAVINLCTTTDESALVPPPVPTIKKPRFRSQNRQNKCTICHSVGHYAPTCPAPSCSICGKKGPGHFESMCPKLRRSRQVGRASPHPDSRKDRRQKKRSLPHHGPSPNVFGPSLAQQRDDDFDFYDNDDYCEEAEHNLDT
jgi:hypothetical protein